MIRFPHMTVLSAATAILLVGVATPASMAQTHSISGRIVIEGREKYGGAVVWVDTLHVTRTDSLGNYDIAGFEDGTYAVKAWAERCLARVVDTVQVAGRDVPGVNDTLFAGDVVEDRCIDLLDVGEILQHLHATPGSASWDASLDLDRSGTIDSLDIATLMRHWKETCDIPPPSGIAVTMPDSAASWKTGQRNVPISWRTGGLQGSVSIVLCRGGSPVDTIADSAPNSGSYNGYNVPVGMAPGANYRVAVRLNNSNYGYSDYFEIGVAIFVTSPDSSTVWSPGQQDVPIQWTTGSLNGPVSISIYKGVSLVQEITPSTPNNGVYATYDVPAGLAAGKDYRIQVLHRGSGVFGYSDYFEIKQFIMVTEPTRSTIWGRGQKSVPVAWITGNLTGDVSITLYKGSSLGPQLGGSANDGNELVDVPTNIPAGADYRIQVSLDANHNDFSDYFTIRGVSLSITAPDTNTVWLLGQQNAPIRWDPGLSTDAVSIGLYKGDNLIEGIASSTPNDGEYSGYNVPVSLAPGNGYSIRIDSNTGEQARSEHFGIEGRSGWVAQYQVNDLYSVSFTDANTGTAVGDYGTILRTTDGGAHWVAQWASTRKKLNCVAFHDANTGLAVGEGGVILKTTDGGATWVGKRNGTRSALYSVAYADADTIVASGLTGGICRTTDGGETWIAASGWLRPSPKAVSFLDAKFGAGASIMAVLWWTNDGGATWIEGGGVLGDYQDHGEGVAVLDPTTAVAVGWQYYTDTWTGAWMTKGVIYTTRNAGASWGTWNGSPQPLNAISSPHGHTATAVGEKGAILRTTDAGVTWVAQTSGVSTALEGVSFTDANTGTAVGTYGVILRTTDGGATWVHQSNATPARLSGMSFGDAQMGIVVGQGPSGGVILRTTDAGITWSPQISSGWSLSDVCMASADTGTAVGGTYWIGDGCFGYRFNGCILRTTDGGVTWTTQWDPGFVLTGVFFVTPDRGMVFGWSFCNGCGNECGKSIRTQDGGVTWASQSLSAVFKDVWFTDANTGSAVSYSGIFHTSDGGTTWSKVDTLPLACVQFTDAGRGTAVGLRGRIARTVDGGLTWTSQSSGTTKDLCGVWFVDANTGVAVGTGGTILRTTDGGATWTQQYSATSRNLWAVHFFDANTGIVVGDGGTILRTTTGGEWR